MIVGCSSEPDYPTLTYLPDGVLFPNPDVEVTWKDLAFDQDEPVDFGTIEVPVLNAGLVFNVEVTVHSDPEKFPVMGVRIGDPEGVPVAVGMNGLSRPVNGNLRHGTVSMYGPNRPGTYPLELSVVIYDDEQVGPRVIGRGLCRVSSHK
ncbi:hypothetical protein [Thalassoglobus neptunius]|uniref:hypothetical protein n=1 Tax=Thalassoglobus neptunius TaxID=1938619 RepID=UPI0011B4F89B|nr:hypothetical protein [Thalassoglobus neptunius]